MTEPKHISIGTQHDGPCEWFTIRRIGEQCHVQHFNGSTFYTTSALTNSEMCRALGRQGFHVVGDLVDTIMLLRVSRPLTDIEARHLLPKTAGKLYSEVAP